MINATLHAVRTQAPGLQFDKIANFFVSDDGVAGILPESAALDVHRVVIQRLVRTFDGGSAYSEIEKRNVPVTEGEAFLRGLAEHFNRTTYYKWTWGKMDLAGSATSNSSRLFLAALNQFASEAAKNLDMAVAGGASPPLVDRLRVQATGLARLRDDTHNKMLLEADIQQGAVPRSKR